MSRTGRPPVLDKEKQEKILVLLSSGCSRRTAALYFNCDPRTIANTAQRDPAFAARLARVEQNREILLLSRLDDAVALRATEGGRRRREGVRAVVRPCDAVQRGAEIGIVVAVCYCATGKDGRGDWHDE